MQIIQSKLLNNFSDIEHCFTTKQSGNLAFHVGDNVMSVLDNHKNIAKYLQYDMKSLVYMQQFHSNRVYKITINDDFNSPPQADALITDLKNRPLMVMVADCAPLLFYDNRQKVIAVAHAGRAGAFSNIVHNVMKSFTEEYSSQEKDIFVSIGAHIKSCCYEVGEEIFEQTKELKLENFIQRKEDKYFLDISGILIQQLQESGISHKNIELVQECTSCRSDTLFSYRVQKDCGRFAGLIYLR